MQRVGAALMDASVVAALDAGRSVITPSPQASARLRRAWARREMDAGRKVWSSPDILTWEAWLAREWQRAADPAHPASRLRVLNRAQERHLWSQTLQELEEQEAHASPIGLRAHASALRRTAQRVRQGLLAPPHAAMSAEEDLLWRALRRVEARAEADSSLILALATPDTLAALSAPAPGFAGVAKLTPLQARLGELLWPDEPLLLPPDEPPPQAPLQWRLRDANEEIRGVAHWCREHLARDPSQRLLVVQGGGDAPLAELAAQLWRHLTEGCSEALAPLRDPSLLVVEGGEPLLQHPMLEQAIAMLGALLCPVETKDLVRLLQSPWFDWGEHDTAPLAQTLCELGGTHWNVNPLLGTLEDLAPDDPAAAACAERLRNALAAMDAAGRKSPGEWAGRFDRALIALGFPGARKLDSNDAQCHARWRELLDEFASLDAPDLRLDAWAAWQELGQLARHGAHEAASGDAAITLTSDHGDPLIGYDGIWVLGLAEEAFPAPPRPDAFLATAAQRKALWPEASVELRREQAMQELAGWQRRTGQLVASYPRLIGDLNRRPSRLLPRQAWQDILPPASAAADEAQMESIIDARMPALAIAPGGALRGVSQRLQLQQDCPFRSQAETRLGARALETPAEGIDPRLRGELLHAALDGLWSELADSPALHALAPQALAELLQRHWQRAERETLRDRLVVPDARVLARERRRGLVVLAQIIELESRRDTFEVVERELQLQTRLDGVGMRLRIDRIDRLADGRRLLIDYKSGQVDAMRLDHEARPLQLALYATALANEGHPVQGLALLRMVPGKVQFTGVIDGDVGPRGIKALADWPTQHWQWQREVQRLLQEHLTGHAEVAPVPGACRRCPLPMLCRINDLAPLGEEDDEEEAAHE